ncbi:MAG: flagellar basal body P-ring formation chaperone FlgA [Paracoccus sp. (in: a-proteobacteria)]|uniref:flagellar basal body P-ring formation chaperone FlgA n=1 Tax=Paracoccus sp. TaxID=267 RepID=UPI0026DEC551|nr:flagellar basal body P-ring formation chaperone FlgA [Paracoccus sp. (in: a-proteobacteria)]MDO5631790.1 flagellar basal body P-ring formation chaperone FlgA [Paracoccus sp. (in: a-proteobacteria)]
MRGVILAALLAAGPAQAEGWAAARTLPAGTVISESDLIRTADARGIRDAEQAIGQQTRFTIYEGRPVTASVLRAPRLVDRNQIVRLAYERGALRIEAEGRALSEGAAGDVIRVMNTASRSTVTARVNSDGSVTVIN